jgi:MFS family permease
MMSVSGQYSGNGLAYFNTVIYSTLGVKTVTKQLGYNVLYSVLSAVGALTGALLTDKMPRRKVLVLGTFGEFICTAPSSDTRLTGFPQPACSAWLGIQAGIQTVMDQRGPDNVSPSLAAGALSAYFLFSTNYMFTYTPLQTVIPAEALETTMRAKGLALSNVITGAMGFLNQFAGPIALGNIGYKYIFVFVAWDFVEAILWYLFGVEAQGRTLEELEWVYEQPNPVKASVQFDKVIVRSDGTVGARL